MNAGRIVLSLRLQAPLITGDPEFRKLDNRIDVQWIHA